MPQKTRRRGGRGRSHSLLSSEQADETVAQLEQLRDHPVRVLGADHPDTLRARGGLADLLGPLVNDWARVLGADYLETLRTRDMLAHLQDRPSEA